MNERNRNVLLFRLYYNTISFGDIRLTDSRELERIAFFFAQTVRVSSYVATQRGRK